MMIIPGIPSQSVRGWFELFPSAAISGTIFHCPFQSQSRIIIPILLYSHKLLPNKLPNFCLTTYILCYKVKLPEREMMVSMKSSQFQKSTLFALLMVGQGHNHVIQWMQIACYMLNAVPSSMRPTASFPQVNPVLIRTYSAQVSVLGFKNWLH